MLNEYIVGRQIKLEGTLKVNGTLTNATTVTIKVKDPSHNVTTYVSPTHPSTGVYSVIITPNIVGTWWWQLVSVGNSADALDEQAFVMKASQFIP
jgi:hypothetical protein